MAADNSPRLVINVGYYQYYLQDGRVAPEYEQVGPQSDGVLSPLGTGLAVSTGVHFRPVDVQLIFAEPAEELGVDDVAGECDLELPSGVVELATVEERLLAHNFGGRCGCGYAPSSPYAVRPPTARNGTGCGFGRRRRRSRAGGRWPSTTSGPRWPRSPARGLATGRRGAVGRWSAVG